MSKIHSFFVGYTALRVISVESRLGGAAEVGFGAKQDDGHLRTVVTKFGFPSGFGAFEGRWRSRGVAEDEEVGLNVAKRTNALESFAACSVPEGYGEAPTFIIAIDVSSVVHGRIETFRLLRLLVNGAYDETRLSNAAVAYNNDLYLNSIAYTCSFRHVEAMEVRARLDSEE